MLADYEADLDLLMTCGERPERRLLVEWPAAVRGFGPIKVDSARKAGTERIRLLAALGAAGAGR